MNPILSIVIPTKDRYKTLFPVLEVLLKYIEGLDYEIVIQDNSTNASSVIDKIRLIDDSRVKYFYSSLQMSQSENSDLAISNCSGKYILFIGDDDLVSPYILQFVSLIDEKKIDCLIYTRGNYFWPDVSFIEKYGFNYPDSLRLPKNISSELTKLDPYQELDHVLNIGCINMGKLPTLYHGIVAKKIMDKVKNRFGTYVPGPSPDMAIGVALTFVLDQYYFTNYPLSTFGCSNNSAAGLGAKSEHVATLESVKWLPKNIITKWDINIPKIWLGQTIYAQSVFEVLEIAESAKSINYMALYKNIYTRQPEAIDLLYPLLENLIGNKFLLFIMVLKGNILKKIYGFKYLFSESALTLFLRIRGDFRVYSLHRNIGGVQLCMSKLKEKLFIE